MRFLCSILLLLSYACIYSQVPSLYFERVTNQNGLSNNQVNCILQDQRGFIWIGTNDGLNRYDGNYFTVFHNRPGDSTSISGNMITGLTEDKNGVLWIISADGGLSRYDYREAANRQFHQFKFKPGDSTSIPTNTINKMLDDGKGHLWLASNGYAVIRFNKQSGKFDRPVKGGPKTALDLRFDAKGKIWVGRQGGGILKIDPATLQAEADKRYEDLYAPLPHVVVTALYCDREQQMWFGSWDKVLYRYNPASNTEMVFREDAANGFVNDEVLSFAEDNKGRLWIGGKTKGLQVYDPATRLFAHYSYDVSREGTLADNTVRCIYKDRSGKLWLGTNRGLSICNPDQQQFQQVFLPRKTGEDEIRIYDFYKDEIGNLWIGTSNGLYIRREQDGFFEHRPLSYNGTPLTVSKFFTDRRGVFYLGTNYSLFEYNRTTNHLQLLPNTDKDQVMNKIIESRVVSIVEDTMDGHPVLLVSPYGHYLAYYDLVTRQWVSRRDTARKIIQRYNIKDNLVRKLVHTARGDTWLATSQEGIGRWSGTPRTPIFYYANNPYSKEGLSNNSVYDIAEDAQHNLWLSTYGGGLHYFDLAANKIQHISATGNLLEGIATDREGNVWMVTNGHLQVFHHGNQSGIHFQLPDIEKTGGVSGYIFRDPDGWMYLSGKNYFIRFHPDSVSTRREPPAIFLTDFRIFNESFSGLLQQPSIRLGYRQNYFTIQFAAPEFSMAEPVRYSYILEGQNKEWQDIGTLNFVTFSNLEAGTYTFRVRASNVPGAWSVNEQRLRIVIVPPFWKTTWFYFLCTAVLLAALYLVYRYRVNELLKRQAIRNKIAQDLHDNLGSTLSSISVYSQVARIHGEKNEKENLDVLLDKIGHTSNEMITEMNDIVWAINPRNDSMEKIVQRMESFAKPLAAARNIRFDMQYSQDVLKVHMDMDKRKNFYLIFKEALNNAIKYAGAQHITAAIATSGNQLQLVVTDDGVGFNPEMEKAGNKLSLSGNGLVNMQKRAEEIKGTLQIRSKAGQGTSVQLDIPLV